MLVTLTEIYFVCNIMRPYNYKKLEMITGLLMNAIMYVSFLNLH